MGYIVVLTTTNKAQQNCEDTNCMGYIVVLTTTKQSTTKLWAYCMGYIVFLTTTKQSTTNLWAYSMGYTVVLTTTKQSTTKLWAYCMGYIVVLTTTKQSCTSIVYFYWWPRANLGALAIQDISTKLILNSNLVKSSLSITYFLVAQSFWNFSQSTAVILPCSV